MDIRVRPLSDRSEFEEAEEVQVSAWGVDERGVTPKAVMIAIHDNGGLVLGAFDGAKMVGFSLLIPGYRGGKVYMYSHQTGVSTEYQSKGVGFLLKQKQREVALKRGFDLIAWTFDPLIARNAHFNFAKLGVISRNYLPNYYGPMKDSINFGLPTDRFMGEWHINPGSLKVIRSYRGRSLDGAHLAISQAGEEPYPRCLDWRTDLSAASVLVDIPNDIVQIKKKNLQEARRWRRATGEIFSSYFKAGYTAVALRERNRRLMYHLIKVRLPRNVLGPADVVSR